MGELALHARKGRAIVEPVLVSAQVFATFDDVHSMLSRSRSFSPRLECASSRALLFVALGVGTVTVIEPAQAKTALHSRAVEIAVSDGAPEASPLVQARSLFQEGVVAYGMSNYEDALAKFSEAFALSMQLADDEQRVKVIHALHFNLARAHAKTYAIDQDSRHLRTAVDLLGKYLSLEPESGDREEAEMLIREAEAELEQIAERRKRARRPRRSARGNVDKAEGQPPMDVPAARGLMVGGIVSLGVAGAGLAVMGAGLAMAQSAQNDLGTLTTDVGAVDAKGQRANGLAIAGLVTAVVCAATGSTLVVLGRKRQRVEGAEARVSVAPWLQRGRGGVAVGGRF